MNQNAINPLHEYRLKYLYRPKARTVIDAPTPWRRVRYMSELDEILDARGFSVAVCRPEHAALIIAAVNGQEATDAST